MAVIGIQLASCGFTGECCSDSCKQKKGTLLFHCEIKPSKIIWPDFNIYYILVLKIRKTLG